MHLPVHLPCYDLPPLNEYLILIIGGFGLGEGDGRCVRALGPVSAGRSIFCLLLNPPSDVRFSASFVFTTLVNVAHFFPSHALHLDLTF